MQESIAFGGPLADPSMWRGALLWAIALYVPLSGPLAAFEASLTAVSYTHLRAHETLR